MKKQYLIIQLETKVSEVPDGYHMTTRTEYFGITNGYPITFDTLEEAEKELALRIGKWSKYTIISLYTQE